MTDTPVFEEPTPLVQRHPPYVARMAPLVRRPREWARIFTGSKASAKVVRSRLRHHAVSEGEVKFRHNLIAVPGDPGDWQYEVGELEDGQWGLWARYVGGLDDPPEGAEIAWDESGASWVPVTSSNGSEGNTGASDGL